jgi:shikimate dehydrogenase
VEVLSDSAQAAGSINVMRPLGDGRWEGDNFDGKGFAAGLAAKGVDLRGRSAYLCGLGGAGSAIAGELLYAGVRRLEIEEINAERAQERISLLPPTFQGRVKIVGPADPIHAEVAINATPLGMKNRGILPFSISRLRNPDTIVCDIIMDPAQTQLLLQAQALGFRTHRGIHMLEKQLQLIVSYFSLDQLPSPALSSTLAAG